MTAQLMTRLLRLFFRHFYHGFAWSYDAVAAVVSLGHWRDWVLTAVPFVQGSSVLELAHGPGHLQAALKAGGHGFVAGLDESAQMGSLAMARLKRLGISPTGLTRGLGQQLPFRDHAFATVVATFPTEFMFTLATLEEARRVLVPGGRLVVLPAAWIVGGGVRDRGAAWLFAATRQVPPASAAEFGQHLKIPLEQAGFAAEFHMIEAEASTVLVVVATAPAGGGASQQVLDRP